MNPVVGIVLVFGAVAATLAVLGLKYNANVNANTVPDTTTDDNMNDTNTQPMPQRKSLDARIEDLMAAISVAEGFGVAGAIPTKYHNPGDLKPPGGKTNYFTGQTGTEPGGHAIFANDDAGWNALRNQVTLIATDRSSVYNTSMNFRDVAMKYAASWQPWLANVLRELNDKGYAVTYATTMREYFYG